MSMDFLRDANFYYKKIININQTKIALRTWILVFIVSSYEYFDILL